MMHGDAVMAWIMTTAMSHVMATPQSLFLCVGALGFKVHCLTTPDPNTFAICEW